MRQARFDVVVAGGGPAGSTAALVLARGGARVALVDRFPFPRDKACGDLVGPRGVQLLAELGITLPGACPVADMLVIGPTGRRIRLPARAGTTYPGHAVALPRYAFDELLHSAAVAAGAEPITARVAATQVDADGRVDGVVLADGTQLSAGTVIGADGATSTVGRTAGLVDPRHVLWGFALRAYLSAEVALPVIALLDDRPGRAFPGYGWLFPGPAGSANFGLGLAMGADRTASARAARRLDRFVADLHRLGLLDRRATERAGASPRLGGWLKMGLAGTVPARGRVLLTGDAAGLVNPLQGEGLAQALGSGAAAAEAVLAGPAGAAGRYRRALRREFFPFMSVTGPLHATLVGHPRAAGLLLRTLTTPPVGPAVAGAWALYWNALLDGATPSRARRLAAAFQACGAVATRPSATRRRLARALGDGGR